MDKKEESQEILNDKVKDILFNALQTSYVDSVIIHKIDSENSAIEMDYENIAIAIVNALSNNGYTISKKD